MDPTALLGPAMASPLLYPLLLGLCVLDGVLPVIPSELAVLAAGAFASTGTPAFWLVVAATALGVVVGDHLAYALSRSVLGPRLVRRSRRIGRAVAAAGRQLDRRAGPLIVGSRFVPGGRVTMNLACGTAGLPLSRFSPASAVAALAWATYIAGLGLVGGAAFVEDPLLGTGIGLALSVVVGTLLDVVRRRAPWRRPGTVDGPGGPCCAPSDECGGHPRGEEIPCR